MYIPNSDLRFSDLLKRRERILGFVWLPIHVVVLPLFLGVLAMLILHRTPDAAALNAFYYLLSFVFVLLAFWSFLRESFHVFVQRMSYCILIIFAAYLLNSVLSVVLNLIMNFFGELETPNNDAVAEVANLHYKQVFATAVLMAPIVEECLFRGVIFGTIARRSRALGYVVSILLFSLYHVWQFALLDHDWTMLLNAVAYIPLSAALTFCYDRTESIWTPIFFHMFVNSAALTLMVQ